MQGIDFVGTTAAGILIGGAIGGSVGAITCINKGSRKFPVNGDVNAIKLMVSINSFKEHKDTSVETPGTIVWNNKKRKEQLK